MNRTIAVGRFRFELEATDWARDADAERCLDDIEQGLSALGSGDPDRLALAHSRVQRGVQDGAVLAIVTTAWEEATDRLHDSGEHQSDIKLHAR